VALALVLALLMGVTLGVFGGGGSILTVPILVHALGLDAKPAIATSLLVVGLTSAAALLPHARVGSVEWRTGASFGAAAMLGAFGGGLAGRFVPGRVLLLLFTAMMAATALAMWRGAGRAAPTELATVRHPLLIALDGLVVGAVTGLVGAGGGFLVVPALVLLGGLPMSRAIGTSLLVIALKSLAGFAGYASHVAVDPLLALPFTAAAIGGSLLGAQTAARVDPERLRRGFAGFVLAMAGFMLWQEI